MKVRFQVTFKQGPQTIMAILGDEKDVATKVSVSDEKEVTGREMDGATITIEDVTEKLIATEQFLEKLTGYRVHIEQVA